MWLGLRILTKPKEKLENDNSWVGFYCGRVLFGGGESGFEDRGDERREKVGREGVGRETEEIGRR